MIVQKCVIGQGCAFATDALALANGFERDLSLQKLCFEENFQNENMSLGELPTLEKSNFQEFPTDYFQHILGEVLPGEENLPLKTLPLDPTHREPFFSKESRPSPSVER